MSKNYQEEAKKRWKTVVCKTAQETTSSPIEIQMKYIDSNTTNKQLLETLAFFHEMGEKEEDGKLRRLSVEMNFGGERRKFIMEELIQKRVIRQIKIDTLDGDYSGKNRDIKTYKTNKYVQIAECLDKVYGKNMNINTKKKIIKERAEMISLMITSKEAAQ